MGKPGARGSWGGATARAAAVRDGAVFAVAGAAPAILAAVLGLRAVRNEEAAVRREATAETAGAAERATRAVRDEIDAAEARLAELPAGRLAGEAATLRATTKSVVPSWADPVLLDARNEPVVEAASMEHEPDAGPRRDARCRRAGAAVARGEAPARRELEGCASVRTPVGGWLVPFALLGRLRDEASDEAASLLVEWLEENASRMTRAERAATGEEIRAGRLDAARREAALRALDGAGSASSAIVSAMRSGGALDALARGPDGRGLVKWQSDGRLAVLRVGADGAVGFVIDVTALARALASGASDGAAAPGAKLRAISVEPPPSDAPRAVSWIAPGLGVEATLRDAGELRARTRRARWGLWAVALGSGSVAIVFALLLFARLRAARRTSELRTSFVAAVSHELRTPIASIRMLSELLEGDRGGDEAERREVASAIARESRRLGETVARLLAWSRMSAGRSSVVRQAVDLAEVVSDAIDVFEERNPGIAVQRRLDPGISIAVDPPLVQLSVLNLLENAKKYAPGGEPYRVVTARDAGGARIEVRDEGPGVPSAWRTRIFEPFERGDDRLSRATDGTGIGLALVRAVARAHGGDATIDASSSRGAAFVVTLGAGAAPPPDGAGDEERGT